VEIREEWEADQEEKGARMVRWEGRRK
jgi:hypothetical protein